VLHILDTDLMSVLQSSGAAADAFAQVLEQRGEDRIITTVITFEEQARGRLDQVRQARKPPQLLRAYHELERLLEFYLNVQVLPFTEDALNIFDGLKRTVRGPGTMDLRIAAVVLVHGGVLLSRNLRDFKKVPGLVVEDWTSEPPGGEATP
jgi:tRNA(fMet)-specific endonuclease VapC